MLPVSLWSRVKKPMTTKQFVVLPKYGKTSGRCHWGCSRKIPYLGGYGKFYERQKVDDIMVKIFSVVHLHGDHYTPKGMKSASYQRAARRFDNRFARFDFQRERDY